MQYAAERRKTPRTGGPSEATMYFRKFYSNELKATVNNISLSGVAFQTDSSLPIKRGDSLEINISPFAAKFKVIIKWLSCVNNKTICGAEFNSLSYMDRKTLYNIIGAF